MAGRGGDMSAEQQMIYHALDAWRAQRSNLLTRDSTDYEKRSQFNEVLVYMRELASVGVPDDPAAWAEFDALLNEIRELCVTEQETKDFDEARDMLEEMYASVTMDEIGDRYGMRDDYGYGDDDDYDYGYGDDLRYGDYGEF